MPVYHARSIAVRLGSMPLAETTTSDVVLKKGEVAKRQSEAAEKKILRSGYLNEKRVLFPGDRDGFELNWLGNAPFMQTQVSPDFTQSSAPDQDPKTAEHSRLQALTLHVKLSDKAFLSGFNNKTHLKIEVLFNGQLSTCSLIHTNDIRSGAKSLHQIFAGYRIDFLAERPWILLPPFTTADGGVRRFRKTITPAERWEEISAAILKEAEERGTDKCGESPPSAAFLHAMASMDMPECVKTMQKPGGRKFGLVDVVITAGFGSKVTTGTNYLKRPHRLRDSNYVVRSAIARDEEVAAADSDDLQDTTGKLPQETNPDITTNEVDRRESGALDERSRKRRGISSFEELPQHLPNKSIFQSPLNPFMSRQIPILPPPVRQAFPNSLFPTSGAVSPRCPSPEYRSDGQKKPLAANDRNRSYSISYESNDTQERQRDAFRVFEAYHSPLPEPELHALQAGSLNPALSSMPLSERTDTRGMIGGPPSAGSPSISSPMTYVPGYQAPSFAEPNFAAQMDTTISGTNVGLSTSFVAPTALMIPTPANWPTPPGTMVSPYCQPMHLPQPQVSSYSYPGGLPSYKLPNELPNLIPQTPPFHEHSRPAQFATPLRSSPPTFQLCGPLPPTAMFSVTSKPRRSSSPDKSIAADGLNHYQHSVLINRLVITGRNGKPLVDHVWKLPQHIIVNRKNGNSAFVGGPAQTPTSSCSETGAQSRAREKNHSPNKTSWATFRTALPPEQWQSNNTGQPIHDQRRDSVQDGQVEQSMNVPLPYLRRHQGPVNEAIPINSRIDVPEMIAPFVPAHLLAAATSVSAPTPMREPIFASPVQPTTLQRRNCPSNALPGIQDLKATSFLFDDPGEVLREAARMRRSRSPTKPAATAHVLHVQPPAHPETQRSSSPLSSVPSSPLAEKPAEVADHTGIPNQLTQLDGSPERTLPATSPRKLPTPSLKKLSFVAPKLQGPDPATPQLSISQKSKKRKALHQSPTRPPRSPGRLKTVDNPPLNDDCVIALAESFDKKEERGVLRQVKGERQGVFREEYVVLAVRFFIAGD